MDEIKFRKIEHIDICLNEYVESRVSPGFSNIHFVHFSLPEVNYAEVSLKTHFLGKQLKAPLIITSMTGGHPETYEINKVLAEVAEKLGLGLGVGSQRAALENPKLEYTFSVVKEYAPTVLKIANIGFVQAKRYSIDKILKAIEMIDANALAIHLNPLQECVQIEGDRDFKGILKRIAKISKELPVPVIVKETGAGISYEVAKEIAEETEVRAIDISGLGGTSWSAVEMYRARRRGNRFRENIAKTFWDWGIPTTVSIVEVRFASTRFEIIGSGGIRSGIDAAKALALGANVAGIALPALKATVRGPKKLEELLKVFIEEIRVAMVLTGSRNVEELRKAKIVITGKTREWLEQRGISIKDYLEKFR